MIAEVMRAYLEPMQLLIQGQWWSNLSTHRSQILQCLLLGVLITWHLEQRQEESNLSTKVRNSIFQLFVTKPGSLNVQAAQNIIETTQKKVISNTQKIDPLTKWN